MCVHVCECVWAWGCRRTLSHPGICSGLCHRLCLRGGAGDGGRSAARAGGQDTGQQAMHVVFVHTSALAYTPYMYIIVLHAHTQPYILHTQPCVCTHTHTRQVLLLENTRFHEGDTSNDEGFSRALGVIADVFVCDAFGVVHRDQGSVTVSSDGVCVFVLGGGAHIPATHAPACGLPAHPYLPAPPNHI